MELFDLFENKATRKLSIIELFIWVAGVSSLDSFQTLEFIHTFSNNIYGLMSNNTPEMTVVQMKKFGKLLGIKAKDMRKTLRKLSWNFLK